MTTHVHPWVVLKFVQHKLMPVDLYFWEATKYVKMIIIALQPIIQAWIHHLISQVELATHHGLEMAFAMTSTMWLPVNMTMEIVVIQMLVMSCVLNVYVCQTQA